MARSDKTLEFIKKTFPKDMQKGAWVTKLPGVGRLLEYLFFEGDTMICLPRDKVVEIGEEVPGQDQVVLPSQLVDHFIDQAEHHVVMDFCICRTGNQCKDYPIEYGCLFMGDAVLDINPDWGKKVTRVQAKKHIKKSQEAGLIHFIGKSKLDTVWLGIGPGDKLLTVCNCCPCCCITRGMPYVAERFSEKLIKAPGVTVAITDDCDGCGACVKTCIFNAITVKNGEKAAILGDCRGCGRCADTCPNAAVTVTVNPSPFTENISRISSMVEV